MAAPKVKLVPADQLVDDPKNARRHSDAQVEHVASLITRLGWTRPIFVDVEAGNMIVMGHGARKAAQLLIDRGEDIYLAPGKERGGAKLPKGRVPIMDVSGWTPEERAAANLSDNRAAEMSEWDTEALTAQLEELAGSDFGMADLGFDQDALTVLASSGAGEAPGKSGRADPTGELSDSTFNYEEQFAVIVRCKDAGEQEARFKELSKKYGADDCKVVVV